MRLGWREVGMVAALAVAGCQATEPRWAQEHRALALAALAQGDHPTAQRLARDALIADPHDPHALFALATALQASGDTALAAHYWRLLVELQPTATISLGSGDATREMPIAEVARARLAALRQAPAAAPGLPPGRPVTAPPSPALGRLAALRQLLDDGLITQGEYDLRRNANLGALLPSQGNAPAAALERPGPAVADVAQRLRDLAQALAAGAISPDQYSAERLAILDALVPRRGEAAPVAATAGADAERLRQLQAAGLISDVEAARELEAQRRATLPPAAAAPMTVEPLPPPQPPGVAGAPPKRPAVSAAPPKPPVAAGAPRKLTKRGPEPVAAKPAAASIHLASPRTEAEARQQWEALRQKYPQQLGPLKATITPTELGGGQGTVYRVDAGPLADRQAAAALCRSLQAASQYCEPDGR